MAKKLKDNDFSSIGQTLLEACQVKWEFCKTGSTLLNNALGGGWLFGGVAGVFGAESTGKTLLALEAAAQCQKVGGMVFYGDAAAVLDKQRAVKVFGLDPTRTLYAVPDTVEEFFEQLLKFSWKCESLKVKGLYVLDDLDTLDTKMTVVTDDMIKKIEKAGSGWIEKADILSMRSRLDKPAVMSALLKTVNKRLMQSNVAAFIISQTRKKIGAVWGSSVTTSGGEALKFYATQRVELSTTGKIVDGEKVVGVSVRARVVKNKVSSPFQTAEYPVYFAYGIDNVESCVDFLSKHSDLFESSSPKRKEQKESEDSNSEERVTKKSKRPYLFEGKTYSSKASLIEAIKEDKTLYKQLLNYTQQVWEQKFKVC